MARYTQKIKERIRMMYATGEHTNADIQKAVKISKSTWHEWKKEKPDFSDLLKEAEEERFQNELASAKKGLKILLEGGDYTEVTQARNDKGKMVIVKKVTKRIPPSAPAIFFSLVNRNPENYKHATKVGKEPGGDPGEGSVVVPMAAVLAAMKAKEKADKKK